MSAVTLAGLSKYGTDWNGERWGGRDRLGKGSRERGEKSGAGGYVMPDYHQRVMGTLKFNVRLVNGILLCIVKSIYNYRW